MPSPFVKGNKLWQQNEQTGAPKMFESPAALWDVAQGYFKWVDDNPLLEEKAFGTGLVLDVKKKRPYTLGAFCIYCGVTPSYFRNFRLVRKDKTDSDSVDFMTVIEHIETAIYEQKFEGASSGFFNANIIARDLGLIDKKEIDNKGSIVLKVDEDDAALGNEEL